MDARPTSQFKRQDITSLSTSQVSSFAPFTHFASTAYCNPSTTVNWSCGSNCQANPDFLPTASGGDGDATQFSSLFPGIPSSVEAHNGFADEQAKTASEILSARTARSSVTVVGHSLGAALALLDGVYLRLNLNATVDVRVIGYGMPRVGNQDFADWVDAHLGDQVTHINNREDRIPILPPKLLGFHHASGEVHITDSGTWESCPGQDNPSTECIVGDVPNIFESNTSDHKGPYDGISMGC
ncbi:lipase class 3 family protein [Lactarius pseudohatsudake]|nr:lipase class 3 family protein [Lactarius pseudohatsudake]